jgi:hypothetical protein
MRKRIFSGLALLAATAIGTEAAAGVGGSPPGKKLPLSDRIAQAFQSEQFRHNIVMSLFKHFSGQKARANKHFGRWLKFDKLFTPKQFFKFFTPQLIKLMPVNLWKVVPGLSVAKLRAQLRAALRSHKFQNDLAMRLSKAVQGVDAAAMKIQGVGFIKLFKHLKLRPGPLKTPGLSAPSKVKLETLRKDLQKEGDLPK